MTPGVSLSPDPSACASTTVRAAPPKGAAPGAPADPDPDSDPESDQGPEEGQEPGAGEEEGEFEEDQPIEIEEVAASAQRSRERSRERPPAVVLRGRAVRSRSPPPRHPRQSRTTPPQPVEPQQRPQRISLTDRPFVLNPAVPPYPKVRFDQQGAWTQAAPASRTTGRNPPLTAFSVPVDQAVWRDPSSRKQIYVGNNADVIPLDDQQILTDQEEDTADPQYVPGRRRADEVDPDQADIEFQFLARVIGHHQQLEVFTLTRREPPLALQLRNQLLLLQRVLLHPAHQLGRVIRKSPRAFVNLPLHHPQTVLEDRNQQVPKFGFNNNQLTLKRHILVSELPVHANIHLQVLKCRLCRKLSTRGIKTHLVLIRLAIPSYPRRGNITTQNLGNNNHLIHHHLGLIHRIDHHLFTL